MQRRTLLKVGLGAGALLTMAGVGVVMWTPGWTKNGLSPPARDVFAAVARAVLDGTLPEGAAEREAALAAHLRRLEASISGLAPATRQELSELLAMLSMAPGRLALAGLGSRWPDASVADLQAALQAMRLSLIATRQQVYHALRDLTTAAYYAEPATWAQLGYPGPTPV
jgi:hypothetical protein